MASFARGHERSGAFPALLSHSFCSLDSAPSLPRPSTALDTHAVSGLPLSSTMPNCSAFSVPVGNWPTITPSVSSLWTCEGGRQIQDQSVDLTVRQRGLGVVVVVEHRDARVERLGGGVAGGADLGAELEALEAVERRHLAAGDDFTVTTAWVTSK